MKHADDMSITPLNEEWEALLRSGLVEPPDDFAARVVARLPPSPESARPKSGRRLREMTEWLALAGALLAGIPQLAAFLFSVWTVTIAG